MIWLYEKPYLTITLKISLKPAKARADLDRMYVGKTIQYQIQT